MSDARPASRPVSLAASRNAPPVAELSVLDRLLASAPDRPPAAAAARENLRRAVHRDVEALLNARRPWRSVPPGLAELGLSPLGYGMPDFTAGSFNDPRQRERVRAEIEATVRQFEPRLGQVRVRLTDNGSLLRGTLHLRIDAVLLLRPASEPIAFDTAFDTTTADMTLNQLYGS